MHGWRWFIIVLGESDIASALFLSQAYMELAPAAVLPPAIVTGTKLPSWSLVKSALNTTTPDQPAYVLNILPHQSLPVLAGEIFL